MNTRDDHVRRRRTRMPSQSAIVAVLATAGLCSSFMFTLMVPIQSKLPELLDASRDDTAWVVTSTLLAAARSAVLLTNIASGALAKLYDPADQVPYFSTIGGVAIVMGIALLLAVRPVLALMRGVR